MGSACYVFAIVGDDTPLPATRGADLTTVPWRELAAVTARTTNDRPQFTVDAVMQHEAIVEAVRRAGPALPVRFGTVFRDTASVVAALAERYEPLAADLDRIGNKVEMSVTALWSEASSINAPSDAREEQSTQSNGASYLRARAAELRRAEELKERARATAQKLDQLLGTHALERKMSLAPTPGIAMRNAYLLNPAAVTAFNADFEIARVLCPELRFLLTGPWPPYSFVQRSEQLTAERFG